MGLGNRLRNAWNAFAADGKPAGMSSNVATYRPDRPRVFSASPQTILASIYNKIAIDVASLAFVHARMDEVDDVYTETIDSSLNQCLTMSANKDQTYFSFFLDAVETMLRCGCVAIVPVYTSSNPNSSGSYDILAIRAGTIVGWKPDDVIVHLYDDRDMQFKDITVPKQTTAIVTNPFYSVMNESNSTLQRLMRKLALLDYVDDQSGSGKLDLIVQLPYTIRGETKKNLAEEKIRTLETQLSGSKFGIGYIDATDRVIQLNRPIDNNLAESVDKLTVMLYNQLGMPESIFDGTCSEEVRLNYYNSTVVPIAVEFATEMTRKYLTPTARTQRQAIMFTQDPFKYITAEKLAELADKLSRNEVMSPNELRVRIGLRPNGDPKSDELRNRNINANSEGYGMPFGETPVEQLSQDGSISLDEFINQL